jgi:PLP dependent protein
VNRDEFLAIRLKHTLKKLERPKSSAPGLVVVSKYSPVEDVVLLHGAGHRHFGENRIDSLIQKQEALEQQEVEGVIWHFIGNIQSNKINRLLKTKGLSYIHSIDSLKLLEQLFDRAGAFVGNQLGLFLQLNTSEEQEKAGFAGYDELAAAVNFFESQGEKNKKPIFYLAGLMTMGKIRTENFELDARNSFKKLMQFKKKLERDFDLSPLKLSMGMSRDFPIALEEGTDWVRIGNAIFSEDHK